jgi:hypothetical protein
MNKLLVNCSVLPIGSRGFLVPNERKNPRFKAGDSFTIKDVTANHLLVKMKNSNSIFGISKNDSLKILGSSFEDYVSTMEKNKKDILNKLIIAMRETGLLNKFEQAAEED